MQSQFLQFPFKSAVFAAFILLALFFASHDARFVGNVWAKTITVGNIQLTHPTIRPTPPNPPVAAGYLTITNLGETDDRLISLSADFADKVEIHEMKMSDGVMQMRALSDGINISAGETVTLAPGGLHLMFVGPHGQMKSAETVSVQMTFENAGLIAVDFTVGIYQAN